MVALAFCTSLSADLYWEEIGMMSMLQPRLTETLEIPDLGFTAFADKVYDRIPLSASGRPAADFLYSTHVAFPPMNGIAPYRPCRYPLAMFSPFRGEKSVKA